jgi:hypothetical protein
MDEQTLNTIAEWELQEDMHRAQQKAVQLGLLKRNPDGSVTITDEGEDYFFEWVLSQPTIH